MEEAEEEHIEISLLNMSIIIITLNKNMITNIKKYIAIRMSLKTLHHHKQRMMFNLITFTGS